MSQSKGLKALKEIQIKYGCNVSLYDDVDKFELIEKEFKQAEENEKLLNVFKNALTLEHHDCQMVKPSRSGDMMSCLVKDLITIRQNELDKSMCEALREWVLKNAFPKELKALEIIKKKPVNTTWFIFYKDYEEYFEETEYADKRQRLTQEEYDLLKEVLRYCYERYI